MGKTNQSQTTDVKPTETVVPQAENIPVPFKSTTVGKTVRTFLQTAAGILVLIVALPEFRTFILENYPSLAVYIPLATAIFTAIQNGADPSVKNI